MARPSAGGDCYELVLDGKGNDGEDEPKSVMTFHFEMTSSGVRALFIGNPWPPARCQRVWAAQPPMISNSWPLVSPLAEDSG